MTILRPLKIVLLFAGLFGFPIVGFWMGVRFNEVRSATKDSLSGSRFSQLKAMLLMYHEEHGSFPPTKYQPKAGGPMHSWRVLLTPHTSSRYTQRYAEYDFSQEWSSTNNLQALGGMPIFRYFSLDGDRDISNYLAISEDDGWPSRYPLKSLLVTNGQDRFLVVEYPDSKIHWMEPKY